MFAKLGLFLAWQTTQTIMINSNGKPTAKPTISPTFEVFLDSHFLSLVDFAESLHLMHSVEFTQESQLDIQGLHKISGDLPVM